MSLIDQELFTTLSATDRVVRNEACLSAKVENEIVLMSIESGCYGGLDDIGGDIWQRLEEPITVTELCNDLAVEYNADRTTIETDVLAFLNALWQKQMIEIVHG